MEVPKTMAQLKDSGKAPSNSFGKKNYMNNKETKNASKGQPGKQIGGYDGLDLDKHIGLKGGK